MNPMNCNQCTTQTQMFRPHHQYVCQYIVVLHHWLYLRMHVHYLIPCWLDCVNMIVINLSHWRLYKMYNCCRHQYHSDNILIYNWYIVLLMPRTPPRHYQQQKPKQIHTRKCAEFLTFSFPLLSYSGFILWKRPRYAQVKKQTSYYFNWIYLYPW